MKEWLRRGCSLALCGLLVGCGPAAGPPAGGPAAPPGPAAGSAPQAAPHPETGPKSPAGPAPRAEYLASCSDDSGYYDLLAYYDGTGSLVRYDYGTMRCTYLADGPDADPRAEDAPGFIPTVVGGAWLLADGRHLYVLKSPNRFVSQERKALGEGFLIRMQPDGGARKTVPLPADTALTFGGTAALEGDRLLVVLCQTDGAGEESWYLAEVDFDTGTIRRRMELEGVSGAWLSGTCARGPILTLRGPEEKRRLCLADTVQNTLETLPFRMGEETWCLDGAAGVVYYLEEKEIFRYDVASGQRQAVPASLPDGDWTRATLGGLVDGYLSATLWGPGEEDCDTIALCLATGEVARPALTDKGDPVIIAAVTPTGYLVRRKGILIRYQDKTPRRYGLRKPGPHPPLCHDGQGGLLEQPPRLPGI